MIDIRTFDVRDFSSDSQAYLESRGIHAVFLSAFSQCTTLDPFDPISRSCEPPSPPSELYALARIGSWPYSKFFLARGGVYCTSPFTLKPVRSFRSIGIEGIAIVQCFHDEQPFYTITTGWRGEITGVFIPAERIILLNSLLDESPHLKTTIEYYFASLMKLQPERIEPCSGAPNLGLAIGFVNNLGHFIWQELAAIEGYAKEGSIEKVERLILGPHCFLDPIGLFPELAAAQVHQLQQLGPAIPELPRNFIRPIAGTVPLSLRDRILRWSESASGKSVIDARRVIAGRFSIWINLRSHNKMWTNQVDGIIELVSQINSYVAPRLTVVIDGWSDTSTIARRIREAVTPTVDVIDTVGIELSESVVWANAIDLFFSVIGSGLVINSWLARKPGIAHGNRLHQHQAHYWNMIGEDSLPTVFVSSPGNSDDGTLYSNYDLETGVALEAAKRLIDNYYPTLVAGGSEKQ